MDKTLQPDTLTITKKVTRKISVLKHMAGHNEVGGLGVVDADLNMAYVWLGTHISSGSYHHQNTESMTPIMLEAREMGYSMTDLRVFWHTHPHGLARPSKEDEQAILEQIEGGLKIITLIVGPSYQGSTARVDWLEGNEHHTEQLGLVWEMEYYDDLLKIEEAIERGRERSQKLHKARVEAWRVALGDGDWGWPRWELDHLATDPDGRWGDGEWTELLEWVDDLYMG